MTVAFLFKLCSCSPASRSQRLDANNVNLSSRRVLTVPRSKNGEMRHVPLNSAALAALNG